MSDSTPPSEPPPRAAPHDALFKQTFERPEHAAGMLRSWLPSEACRRIDWSTLQLVPGSFRDEELRDSETDVLFSAQLEGREAHRNHESPIPPARQVD